MLTEHAAPVDNNALARRASSDTKTILAAISALTGKVDGVTQSVAKLDTSQAADPATAPPPPDTPAPAATPPVVVPAPAPVTPVTPPAPVVTDPPKDTKKKDDGGGGGGGGIGGIVKDIGSVAKIFGLFRLR